MLLFFVFFFFFLLLGTAAIWGIQRLAGEEIWGDMGGLGRAK
jgi:hypothetical protein